MIASMTRNEQCVHPDFDIHIYNFFVGFIRNLDFNWLRYGPNVIATTITYKKINEYTTTKSSQRFGPPYHSGAASLAIFSGTKTTRPLSDFNRWPEYKVEGG